MGEADDLYARQRRSFRWRLPPRYNIGVDICDKWARRQPGRVAILEVRHDHTMRPVDYGTLRQSADRLANVLRRAGIGPGERVAILLPQCAEVVVAHAAIARLGALAVPLAALFGPDALAYRLVDCAARAMILDAAGLARIRAIPGGLPALELILCVDGPDGDAVGYHDALDAADPAFEPVMTHADDPAMMIYTSGTTGQPKGAVHAHRVLPGHVPGLRFAHQDFGRAGDLMWTPADWAWAGGLLNALLPSLSLGVPVVAWPHDKFVPAEALEVMAATGVRNAFLPPTALRMMKVAGVSVRTLSSGGGTLALRSIMSAGETLGPDMFEWAREAFGFAVNELYGQTECNLVLGSSAAAGISRAGYIGKPVPGHTVAVIRPDATRCDPGEAGEIAVLSPDPVMFLSYWGMEDATRAKMRGRWMVTGDQAVCDEEGYVRFVGRDDDLITSSGYRIGPGEIEDCLMRHPSVAAAAAIGKPDAVRTQIVKAFLVLKPGVEASEALTAEIQAFVRRRLSAHEYPREVSYVAALPLTASGKIVRRLLREAG